MVAEIIKIADAIIGPEHPPFVIAELSGNHGRDFEKAKTMIRKASESGVQAIKLQTYTADSLTLNAHSGEFLIAEDDSLWRGRTLYDLYSEASTPYEWHKPLFEYANSLGMIAFSSPFDEAAVDFLETLNVPCYKIASFENNHIPLIKKVAQTGKPIILSTGMASAEELHEAVTCARDNGCNDLVLLKCTSHYPATAEGSHLRTIQDMKDRLGCLVGLSDHTTGIAVPIAAVAMGAVVIEKHFKLAGDDGSVDAAFSLTPDEMAMLVKETKRAWLSLGGVKYGGAEEEQASKKYRRSIYVSAPVSAGDIVSVENVKVVRPAFGMHPRSYEQILGRRFRNDVEAGTPLDASMLLAENGIC